MDSDRPNSASPREAATFFALAYALSWGWLLPFAFAGAQIERGDVWPSHLPFLAGPAVAAILATIWFGRGHGLLAFARDVFRWRVAVRWWLVALSPLAFLAVALLLTAVGIADTPAYSDFGLFNALPKASPLVIWTLITVCNGFGEEMGWRGFALPRLQQRFSPFTATLILAAFWAAWHIPSFFVLRTYEDYLPVGLVPFVLGLGSGAFLLTWLYNRSGGSVLLVAVWHGTYNFTSATAASEGFIAAVVSTLVMVVGISLAVQEYRARRDGRPTIIGPHHPDPPPALSG